MKTNNSRWFDWFSAILLVASFLTVAIRLRVTQWTANLEIIEILVFFGCVLGLLIGTSRFNVLVCQLFAVNFTVFFIPWQLGLLISRSGDWDQRLLGLIGRLSYSVQEVVGNRPIQDSLLFLTTMSLFFWILALVAGYQLSRHGRPWAPLFLLGLALAIVDFYTPFQGERDRYSAVFVFFILLLVARLYLLRSRREWYDKGMAVDPEIGFDLGRTVAFSGLILVVLAWNVPNVVDALTPGTEVQKQLARSWESVRNRFQNAVAGLQNPVSITSDFYGSEMALGTGGTQGDERVFTVQISGFIPAGVRFYWKARSFDVFDGKGWITSEEKTTPVPANEWPFQYPALTGRQQVTLNFIPSVASIRNIYTAGMPLQISRPTDALAEKSPDGTTDIVALIANPALKSGEVTTVRAWVTAPTVLELRKATNTYPETIKNQYLQLPATLSPRVVELAKQITEGKTTPYDQVMAVTDWLRSNIEYSLTVPSAPAGRDILEWFLFDLKQGYCNYYATAEVVMLRSLGIPARLAVGYAEGESEQQSDFFTVRRRDSHAWPEVYFQNYGWVEFEPTAAQPATALASGETNNNDAADQKINPRVAPNAELPDENMLHNPAAPVTRTDNTPAVIAIISTPLLLAGGVFLLLYLRRTGRFAILVLPLPVYIARNLENRGINPPDWLKNWANHLELTPMEKLFSRLNWMLFVLGQKVEPHQTPAERVADLVSAAPNALEPAQAFLEEYQRDEYSLYHGDYPAAARAQRLLWREVALGALRRIIVH